MISAFGPQAQRYATLLGDMDAVICDQQALGQGYLEAVRRREVGEPFYGMWLSDDPRVAFGYRYADEMMRPIADFDRRRMLLEQLAIGALPVNGQRVDQLWGIDPDLERVAVEFFGLCDAMLVRSFAEYQRWAGLFARNIVRRPLRPVECAVTVSIVPDVPRVRPERPGVVIWAPYRPAVEMSLLLYGLAEFHGELTCVSAGGPVPARSEATFLLPGDPRVAEALSRASAVVCAEPSDPSDAVAFARLGYGVVAPITSGAHEFAGDIVAWDALDSRFLFTLVAVAVARPASVHAERARPPRAPARPPRPDFITESPLISVITPTYNRREDLKKMLSCIAAQTYTNVESIVVNDGGEAVDDIVAAYPFAKLINLEKNTGGMRALAIGRDHARGEYIGILPDDDWYYPDHFERLMNAIFRSGCSIAHGTALLRYLEQTETGAWRTSGFNATTFSETLAPTDALVTSTVGGNQLVVPARVYEELGWYIADSDVADNEIHARWAAHYFYAFVDHVTSEFRDHEGSMGRSLDFVTALKRVYSELHPRPDRPLLNHIREATIENVRQREAGKSAFSPTIRLKKTPD